MTRRESSHQYATNKPTMTAAEKKIAYDMLSRIEYRLDKNDPSLYLLIKAYKRLCSAANKRSKSDK